MDGEKVYTVTELTRDILKTLETGFSEVWVEGEVSNFTVSSAGHAYFSLKDAGSLLNCVMFRSASSRLKFTVEDGMMVLCRGGISVYGKRGQYQLYVDSVEPRGQGALQQAFEQLKTRLAAEGLFDEEKKRPLPYLPVKVGVVTSPTGAAIKDIIKVARRRFANIEMMIKPVRVQGDEAKDEIALAIEEFNEYNRSLREGKTDEHEVDVLIVGRGGGSLEDLWPFNEEKVARAIRASEIPVVSAVGHQIDFTISDFAADMRAPTPSAAAEIVLPVRDELSGRLDRYRDRLKAAVARKVGVMEKEVDSLRNAYVLRAPANVFLRLGQQVDDLIASATSNVRHTIELKGTGVSAVAGKLRALSPVAVLERGYSITFRDGKVVKDAGTLKKGDVLETRLSSGEAVSRVEDVR